MLELWRRWAYPRFENSIGRTDDPSKLERLWYGPWTPELVKRMPIDVLLAGPTMGGIDATTRKIIDLEIERRMKAPHVYVGYAIGVGGLIIALVSALRS